jgi:UDP-glucose 4-epimerase
MSKKINYILVTGGAGYIGSILTAQLVKKKYNVIVLDNLSTGSKLLLNKKVKFIKIDLKNLSYLKKKLKNYNIQSIFHFAASLSVPESQKKPLMYYQNNVIGTENLIKIAQQKKIKKFIFSSTCAVYGNSFKAKVSENDITLPESNYGKTKLMAENLVINSSKKFRFKYAILRYFNVIGANLENNLGQIKAGSLFKKIANNVSKNKFKIDLYGNDYQTRDGTCIRDYIDVNDLCDLHLQSFKKLKKSNSFILNCGYNIGYSVKEIIQKFSKIIKKNIIINLRPKRAGDVEAIYCNNLKIKKLFPKWKRHFSISQSIKDMIKWEHRLNKLKC